MASTFTPPGNGSSFTGSVDLSPDLGIIGKALGLGDLATGWIDDLVRKHVLSHGSGGSAILSQLASVVDDFLAVAIEFIGKAQGTNTPGFFTLLGTVLGDVIGADISADAVEGAWRQHGTMGGFRAVGKAYWNALFEQLGSPSTISPAQGLASAQGFLGYLLGFAIREGNLALIDSIIPEEFRVIDGIEEYPRAIRGALGLGRMARQALHPLIQTFITDPLQWWANQTYRPKLLGEGLAVRAYNRGWISREALDTELQYAGYSDDRGATVTADSVTYLTPQDAWELYKTQKSDISGVNIALRLSGFDPNSNDSWVAVRTAQAVQPYIDQLIQDFKTQWLGGYITLSQLEGFIDQIPMLPDVRNALYQALGQIGEYPRRKLTLAEVQSAFTEGIYTLDDVTAFLQGEGYGQDAVDVLILQTMLKLGTVEAKRAVAQYSYDKAKAKAAKAGEPEPPPPAILVPGPTG